MLRSEIDHELQRLNLKYAATLAGLRFDRKVRPRTLQHGLTSVPSIAGEGDWRIELPEWCRDQRNQMTGPADNVELVVKMLNSGAPGVMLDLEDSMVNHLTSVSLGIANIIAALHGDAWWQKPGPYHDDGPLMTKDTKSVIFVRPRGLHLNHPGTDICAALYDVVNVALQVEPKRLKHPLSFYIPKSESAKEAYWWRDVFREIADIRGWKSDYIKCMALVESAPLAYEMEEFIYVLRDHIMGLNLGRWDYMASLIHWNLDDPAWVLPDRNKIPHDVPFFQALRRRLVHTCHTRGILAIGGMTALFPNRLDYASNVAALEALERDKKNESAMGFDGAWTGHPDQNEIAVKAFPEPNQIDKLLSFVDDDLNSPPDRTGKITLQGTRDAIKSSIRYRCGVLRGKGATLLDGFMEDLATDRIYRLMIAQRMKHWKTIEDWDPQEWAPVTEIFGSERGDHSVQTISNMFEQISDEIISDMNAWEKPNEVILVKRASFETLESILTERFNPE